MGAVFLSGVVCKLCGAKRILPEHVKTNGEGRKYHADPAECWGEVVERKTKGDDA